MEDAAQINGSPSPFHLPNQVEYYFVSRRTHRRITSYPTHFEAKLMSTHRYSLRSLLIATAIVSAYFPLAKLYHSWFTTTYDSYYVTSVLASKIHNGDSVDAVATHFASYRILRDTDSNDMQNVNEIWGSNNLTREDTDQYYHFSTRGGAGAYLQFRDGRLANMTNSSYSDASRIAVMNHDSIPNPILRLGLFPIYLILVACVALILASRQWIQRSSGSNHSLAAQNGG